MFKNLKNIRKWIITTLIVAAMLITAVVVVGCKPTRATLKADIHRLTLSANQTALQTEKQAATIAALAREKDSISICATTFFKNWQATIQTNRTLQEQFDFTLSCKEYDTNRTDSTGFAPLKVETEITGKKRTESNELILQSYVSELEQNVNRLTIERDKEHAIALDYMHESDSLGQVIATRDSVISTTKETTKSGMSGLQNFFFWLGIIFSAIVLIVGVCMFILWKFKN